MITTVPLIILNGWGHPDPPPKLGALRRITQDATAQTTRRVSGDPEWRHEFDAFIYGYLAGSKTLVLLDLRKHDPNTL